MNKNDYINAVDNITAPAQLKSKIEALEKPAKNKKPFYKTATAVAACFVAVVLAFSGFAGTMLSAEKSNDSVSDIGTNMFADEEFLNAPGAGAEAPQDQAQVQQSENSTANNTVPSERKIVKTASLSIKTKNYEKMMADIKQMIEQYGGYIEQSQEYNYDTDSDRNANMDVKIPSDKLEAFIEELSQIGTITSKSISSEDITDSYIDVESRIKALEIEEKTLLGLLKKAENLKDVIEIQDRLSEVRTDLESMKSKKQSYDGMVAYSGVSLNINEVERVVEGGDTFFGQIKEKLLRNLYSLADFFRTLAINLIASLPYIAVVGVAFVIVIVVLKKIRKRKV